MSDAFTAMFEQLKSDILETVRSEVSHSLEHHAENVFGVVNTKVEETVGATMLTISNALKRAAPVKQLHQIDIGKMIAPPARLSKNSVLILLPYESLLENATRINITKMDGKYVIYTYVLNKDNYLDTVINYADEEESEEIVRQLNVAALQGRDTVLLTLIQVKGGIEGLPMFDKNTQSTFLCGSDADPVVILAKQEKALQELTDVSQELGLYDTPLLEETAELTEGADVTTVTDIDPVSETPTSGLPAPESF